MQIETVLKTVMPAAPVKIWADALINAFEFAELNTPLRQASFLAQCAAESAELTRLTENLNYGEGALIRTFPSRFTPLQARDYARNPEKIANRAYADRYGNGPEVSGDGFRYRGRGPLQITFRANYRECAKATSIPCVAYPEIIERPMEGAISAAWYWRSKSINAVADSGDINAVTKLINPAMAGALRRKDYYLKALQVLTVSSKST